MNTTYSRLDLPASVSSITCLPDCSWQERWDRIIVDQRIKDRLRNFALFSLAGRGGISRTALPTHGLAVLAGPPGTGKTSLAFGLGQTVATDLTSRALADELLFVVLDAHAFPSEMLGATQRGVAGLFDRTIPELAESGKPVVILLDEVESLVVSRSRASFETNPVDVHRATDAVLTGLDAVAARLDNVLFLATTNAVTTVDEAFLSRADLVEEIGLPSARVLEQVLLDSLREVTGDDGVDGDELRGLAVRGQSLGLDARQARKLILRAITSQGPSVALAPDTLKVDHIADALDGFVPS